ncbi:MAG TPA: adenylyltransferase/cytidyltransferase family protein [Candidatus Eremiobacteraceae bacterium]|nr:adenylyltransferase/cytidyltransferase family protein [Candidatus Eremiobacteraceae bacterium]
MRAADKVLTREALAEAVAQRRATHSPVVFTNGVFDLLHIGHVRYLEFARGLGKMLVVGVNSDESVRSLGKEKGRPIVPAAERAEVVAALASVDFVCIFDEQRPDATIRALRPDIHVKSTQYKLEDLPEAGAVAEVGAKIVLAPHLPASSTTDIVRRIREGASP